MSKQEKKLGESMPADSKAEKPDESHKATEQKKSGPKIPAESDLFLLERLYPEAHRVFQPIGENLPSSPDTLVALDTNALLLPYLLGKGDITELSSVYSRLSNENRLFLPARAAREFIKNHDRKIAEIVHAIDVRASKSDGSGAKVSSLLLDGFVEREELETAIGTLDGATRSYSAALKKLSAHFKKWRGNDPVSTLYASLFQEEKLVEPRETLEQIEVELKYRNLNQVPPGYKDSGKVDEGVGDLIIWLSLLTLARTRQKDLIFITGEQKADWYVRSGGQPIYPRPELVEAYRYASGGRSLRLASLHEVLKEMSAPESLVTNVEAAEAVANSAVQAATSVGRSTAIDWAEPNASSWTHVPLTSLEDDMHTGGAGDSNYDDALKEIELEIKLNKLSKQLNRVRATISQLTHDDINTSLSLPWNRAAQGLRAEEVQLNNSIADIRARLHNSAKRQRD